MMSGAFWVILILIGLGSIGAASVYWGQNYERMRDNNNELITVGVVCLFATFVMFIVSFSVSLGSQNSIITLEAFQTSRPAYCAAISETERLLSEGRAETGALTDLAYQGQISSASERVRELRNRNADFNRQLNQWRTWNRVPLLALAIVDPPEELQPIIGLGCD